MTNNVDYLRRMFVSNQHDSRMLFTRSAIKTDFADLCTDEDVFFVFVWHVLQCFDLNIYVRVHLYLASIRNVCANRERNVSVVICNLCFFLGDTDGMRRSSPIRVRLLFYRFHSFRNYIFRKHFTKWFPLISRSLRVEYNHIYIYIIRALFFTQLPMRIS